MDCGVALGLLAVAIVAGAFGLPIPLIGGGYAFLLGSAYFHCFFRPVSGLARVASMSRGNWGRGSFMLDAVLCCTVAAIGIFTR
ncbi:MAG: hypothetical protein NVS9B1_24050 [Candidatus Dormibacteraceae bacterium]